MSDDELVNRLRAGDEAAFAEVVTAYHPAMVRLARTFVPSQAVAEEVAQESWIAVLRGISGFEGRSSLKTWIFHIVANRARSIGVREHRVMPVDLGEEGSVDRRRFDEKGAWSEPPPHWSDEVVERLSSPPLLERVRVVLEDLPEGQRAVVTLRDLDGLSSREVCDVLGISEANQRVLLHRGRSRVRTALEEEVARS